MNNKTKFIAVLIFLSLRLFSQNLYVSSSGSDINLGNLENPLRSISTAVSKIKMGDTIFVRGGEYKVTSSISISKSGNDSLKYFLFAYRNEKVLLNCSSMSLGTKGIKLNASYWHIKGLDVKGAGDNGMEISGGSYNIIEQCNFYENRDSGLQLSNGAAYNKIINCDSYYNADPPDYGDADGFAPKLTVGTGNYFYGCRSWGNCDDGWDGYLRGADDVTTTLENCWTFGNGYLKSGTDPGAQANGNGFKMGGGDNSNSGNLKHNFILKNCLAFDNKVKGFDQNNNVGSMTLLNCTAYRNGSNYKITKPLVANKELVVKNSVVLGFGVELGTFAVQQTNSWLSPFIVTNDDFISIDTIGVRSPRSINGMLPEVQFLHLKAGSDLIDSGTDVGITFNGKAPDLGCFEYGTISNLEIDDLKPAEFVLEQNFPNPFNPSTNIVFTLGKKSNVQLDVFNLLGETIQSLLNSDLEIGTYSVKFNAKNLSSGIYIYRININGNIYSKKMTLMK